MSTNPSSLTKKIDGAKDLQAVVRSMKALAASSISQYERSVLALKDYDRTVELGLGACFRALTLETIATSPVGQIPLAGAVVFGSDQGLVGQFNDLIADYAVDQIKAEGRPFRVWAIGERVQGRLADAGLKPAGLFNVPGSVAGITALVGQILIETEPVLGQGQMGELHLYYNRTTIGAAYEPTAQRLLPLDDRWRQSLEALPWPTKAPAEVLGNRINTLKAFVRGYLFISLFRACAESLASENASRLAAMERADHNIDELLATLGTSYHRLRQGGIDEELFDVVSGFEALG